MFLLAGSVHKNLRYFERLEASDLQHRVVKRGTEHGTHPHNRVQEVAFNALGRCSSKITENLN
jgi:hypothetical protein